MVKPQPSSRLSRTAFFNISKVSICFCTIVYVAAGLLSSGPGLVTKGHHWKNGIWLQARNQLVFVYQQEAKSASRFSVRDLFVTKGVTSRGLRFAGCFWSIVLSPMRRHSSFRRSYWYHSSRKKEIYNFRLVPGRQISKGVVVFVNHFVGTFLQQFGGFGTVLSPVSPQ